MTNITDDNILTEENIWDLRKKIEEQLKNAPQGIRVYIPKVVLEQLLFEQYDETIHINESWKNNPEEYTKAKQLDGIKAPAKYLVWSGPFLSKIDLGEIIFDDIIWNLEYDNNHPCILEWIHDNACRYKKYDSRKIDLSNTNATIDFSKSFWAKIQERTGIIKIGEYKLLEIFDVNFENVDLSESVIDNERAEVQGCNFENTGLKVVSRNKEISFVDSNMRGTNLKGLTIPYDYIYDQYMIYGTFNFINTGLNITVTPDDIASKTFKEIINSGRLHGCFINGQLVSSQNTLLMLQTINSINIQIQEYRSQQKDYR